MQDYMAYLQQLAADLQAGEQVGLRGRMMAGPAGAMGLFNNMGTSAPPATRAPEPTLGIAPSPAHKLGQGAPAINFDTMLTPGGQPAVSQAALDAFGMPLETPDISDLMKRQAMRDEGVDAPPGSAPGLTPQQTASLMGLMPDGKGFNPPGAVAPRVTPFNAQMAQLQAGSNAAPRRLSLGDLIYGAR